MQSLDVCEFRLVSECRLKAGELDWKLDEVVVEHADLAYGMNEVFCEAILENLQIGASICTLLVIP